MIATKPVPVEASTGLGYPLVLPSKVQARHLERVAAVYIRQSTLQQVQEHRESTALQYALRSKAIAWGWSGDRVLVIDEDLGCSGASAEMHAFAFGHILPRLARITTSESITFA